MPSPPMAAIVWVRMVEGYFGMVLVNRYLARVSIQTGQAQSGPALVSGQPTRRNRFMEAPRKPRRRAPPRRLHQEHALAAALPIEGPVGLLRLVQTPPVGEQRVEVEPALDDEVGAGALALDRHGPGGQDSDLGPEQRGE